MSIHRITMHIQDSESISDTFLSKRYPSEHADTTLDGAIDVAFGKLQAIIKEKKAAEDKLGELFEERKKSAMDELEKARRRLKFVEQEERRLKGLVIGECFKSRMDLPEGEISKSPARVAVGKLEGKIQPRDSFMSTPKPPPRQPSPEPPPKQKFDDWGFEVPADDAAAAQEKTTAEPEEKKEANFDDWGFEMPPEEEEAPPAIEVEAPAEKDKGTAKNFAEGDNWGFDIPPEEEATAAATSTLSPAQARREIMRLINTPKMSAAELLGDSVDPQMLRDPVPEAGQLEIEIHGADASFDIFGPPPLGSKKKNWIRPLSDKAKNIVKEWIQQMDYGGYTPGSVEDQRLKVIRAVWDKIGK